MSQEKLVIEHIASIATAYKRCLERSQEPQGGEAERWKNRHLAALGDVERDTLPHGAGFDCGVSLDWETTDIDAEKYAFRIEFHVHGEHGYVGWATYQLVVTPSFIGNITMDIEKLDGPDDDEDGMVGLDDYICETMNEALTKKYVVPAAFYADM